MFCIACQHDLSYYICPDIDDRLEKLSNHQGWLLEACKRCGKIRSRCTCCGEEGTMLRRCLRCKAESVSSDAQVYRLFCSDLCEKKWWRDLERLATFVAAVGAEAPRLPS